jgi:DNA-binding CsgD family transcriptional regulator
VLLLTTGFSDSPTTREKQLAIETLAQRGNIAGTGLLTTGEIAQRLGIADNTVRALRSQFRALRTTRTQRRLADVRSKAMRVARALEKETNR